MFKVICGSDMDMILNHFFVFWEPKTSNFTRHKFLDLFFSFCFLMTTKLMSIFQTFVPQYITVRQVPYTGLKSHFSCFISSKWQERWSSFRDNKLFKIKPSLSKPAFRKSSKEEVVLSRLRIGHTYFSHSYILRLLCQTHLDRLY